MQFTTGSYIFLFIIALVILVIILFSRWRNGQSFNVRIPHPKISTKQVVEGDTTPCFNIYKNKMIIENKEITDVLYTWDIRGKPYVFQGCIGEDYFPIMLPDDITYQPSRLSRMIGCIPLKRLKSLKFSILEQLAPFAPVVAIGIGVILYLIVTGD